jgi:Uma2 family endonuclease
MNSLDRRTPLLSVEDYLELEASSTIRHEYVDGYLYALAGASQRHNEIVLNVSERLRAAARRGNCRVRAIEIMLRNTDSRYYYPDVLLTCDPKDFGERAVSSPCVIVEVLSPSTEQVDQREKLFAYTTIQSLRAFYIVHQDRRTVENHWRDDEGTWWHGTLHGGGALHVPCLNNDLPLEEIYEGVTFDDG